MNKFFHISGVAITLLLASCGTRSTPAFPAAVVKETAPQQSAKLSAQADVMLEVLARYPHDTSAFTEGLQLVDGLLYESTGLNGQSSVRITDLASGAVLQSRAPTLATAFGEGLTVLNGIAYQLTYTEGKAFKYDAQTLESTGTFSYSGQGWGLTNDGKSLIMSDGSARLTWRDPNTFAIQRTVNVTQAGVLVRGINEMEYVNGKIYANVFPTNRMVVIDPATGAVNLWFDLTPLAQDAGAIALSSENVPNGIAYNPERQSLLLTGKNWPYTYEISLSSFTGTTTPANPTTPSGTVTTTPASGVYKLVNRRSGLALTATSAVNGQQLVQQAYTGTTNQQWMLNKTSTGYTFINRATGKAMDVSGGSTTNGAKVVQWTLTGATNQLWKVAPTDSGFVKVTSVRSAKALAVANGSTNAGAGIVQWSFGTAQNDQWQISTP